MMLHNRNKKGKWIQEKNQISWDKNESKTKKYKPVSSQLQISVNEDQSAYVTQLDTEIFTPTHPTPK